MIFQVQTSAHVTPTTLKFSNDYDLSLGRSLASKMLLKVFLDLTKISVVCLKRERKLKAQNMHIHTINELHASLWIFSYDHRSMVI